MKKKICVAIVNDDETIGDLIRFNLEQSKYEVRCYRNTRDALELIERPADIALLDFSNTPMDGVELYGHLRSKTRMSLIFLSAWAGNLPDMLQRRDLMPADGYIGLPFNLATVMTVIETALSSRAV